MRAMSEDAATTWHHGLVADYWAEFEVDGPEIEYFGRFVERWLRHRPPARPVAP
jgi:hypothetical protein